MPTAKFFGKHPVLKKKGMHKPCWITHSHFTVFNSNLGFNSN